MRHNVLLAVTDPLSPLFQDIFPGSEIAKGYASMQSKTTRIINGSLAPHFKSRLIGTMKSGPFSVAVHGLNDSGLEKMNPMTVRYFDVDSRMVSTQLLGRCLTSDTIIFLTLTLSDQSDQLYVGRDRFVVLNVFFNVF